MRLVIRFVVCFASLGMAAPVWAGQSGTVTGVVLNTQSSAPVANALVVIEMASGNREVRTGRDGRFTMANVPSGDYHATVRADGFLPLKLDVTVTGASAPLEIKLNTEPHFSEVVSVSPDARSQLDSYQPTNVVGGQDLALKMQGTLGATLANEPGVALRSFGPGPARPVIRGLDGDRVLVLQDGQRMGDLSSQSGDHGVNIDPASASTIEVVRGPATLLYGANAIGGLVNVLTKSIPANPVRGATGSMTFDAGSGAGEAGGAGDVTVGNGRLALHVAGSGRRAGDYRAPDGTVPNSFSRAEYGEGGLSFTGTNGYLGGSIGYDRTHYGIPLVEEGETNLDPRRTTFDLRGERRNLGGFITGVRGALGVRRYRHDELDGQEVATSFTNNTSDLELLASHRPVGGFKGSFGASFLTRTFLASGEEVLSPQVGQTGAAAYVYEEKALNRRATLQLGARVDRAAFAPKEDLTARAFNNVSGSVGLLIHAGDQTTLAFSLARASRNPALEELYFHGPHGGNNAFENGDDTLKSEHALGFDASVRWAAMRATGEVTYFVNRIDNFIFRQLNGEVDDDLPVSFFTQGDATLHGVESHLDIRIGQLFWFEGGVDVVRGTLRTVNMPLPRMPPLRGRLGLRYQKNAFQAGFDVSSSGRQDRIFSVMGPEGAVGETPTAGYTIAKVFVAYSFATGRSTSTLALRVDNAGNALYHNHLNYLKDLAPEMGRDVRLTFTVKF